MSSFLIKAVQKNPVLFNAATGGFLCASSDAVAQQWEEHSYGPFVEAHPTCTQHHPYLAPSLQPVSPPSTTISLDWQRLASAACIGSFFGGILYPVAYARLDAYWVGTHWKTVLVKSLAEIATVGIMVNTISLAARGFVRGDRTMNEVVHHVSNEIGPVTKNDFLVWLPYNLIAFSLIPAILRPTTTAAMEASWQTYISLRAHDY